LENPLDHKRWGKGGMTRRSGGDTHRIADAQVRDMSSAIL
jgi:hypothetical protein